MTDTAERQRRVRAERRAAGLCTFCGEERDDEAYVLCGDCRQVITTKAAVSRAERVVCGRCPRCGGERDVGFMTCARCLDSQRRFGKAR